MKIVLPLAGKGTRLLPHTEHMPKPLMFIAGLTILDYLMKELIPLQASEFVFITGYKKEMIENHIREYYPEIKCTFIEQKNPQGLGHAIYQARDAFTKDEDMLVILGDQTFTIDWKQMLKNTANRISVVKVDNPSSFGIVEIDPTGLVVSMEEKPEFPKSNLAISGTYYFPSAQSVFAAIAHQIQNNIRTRGEIQITDAMKLMLDSGEKFETLTISDWNDCGNHEDLIQANKTLLEKYPVLSDLNFGKDVCITGSVSIAKNVILENVTINGNVSLASGVVVKNSVLSDTVVDENTTIDDCILSHSYIGRDMHLKNKNSSAEYLA